MLENTGTKMIIFYQFHTKEDLTINMLYEKQMVFKRFCLRQCYLYFNKNVVLLNEIIFS